jgi:hypothetical protein
MKKKTGFRICFLKFNLYRYNAEWRDIAALKAAAAPASAAKAAACQRERARWGRVQAGTLLLTHSSKATGFLFKPLPLKTSILVSKYAFQIQRVSATPRGAQLRAADPAVAAAAAAARWGSAR